MHGLLMSAAGVLAAAVGLTLSIDMLGATGLALTVMGVVVIFSQADSRRDGQLAELRGEVKALREEVALLRERV